MLSAMKNIKYGNGILSDGESYCWSDGLGRPLERYGISATIWGMEEPAMQRPAGEQVPGKSSDHSPWGDH